jgi:hypothetical protein
MQMQPIESSTISHAGYDAEKQTLVVQFKTGAIYEYSGVPEEEYDGLMSAGSAGAYLHQNIKGVYYHRKV